MATQVVQMDYEVIEKVSKGFQTASEVLTAVGKALEVAIGVLRAMAFVSLGTTEALARYLEQIKNKVNKLAKLCEEFSGDLAGAMGDHKRGDYKSGTYFRKGIKV